ncbi:TPA: UDP-N-acetylglucosamine 2-epimerase (non-hydrolyzing) [Pasteurella multocida]|uniref:UDP-N-acetylglucosamine 2-epimerase (Non-hydrolyzing) n=1 Tax=Pasteurella multocida TaxID=747 RepID=A0A849CHL8_PASMD|nr:UDP-N-acetylglucosamine 2-epimerase (non-hydrolyzing) [Pasteurella multocida]AFF23479.1 UDP-N-acetylglucosamine 2-epimerase [Pasteurella multocida subsp. multocida str. HN06]AFI45377.1 UDP-N-acetylglucosamine 2-epimerase [Pasteurella multocida subsp. multocida str. 3480]AHE63618.1 UDP-N-acetylglucosamine 2-epimerase [Pasteurella multocida subsp. multocida str. HB03]AIN48866.1 UDP-N-acetylglucosamine 2-epimerase [Pasteurella multocida]APB78529.1 UDP-N-acetylglucosamine 2-epimerase [Pasteurel
MKKLKVMTVVGTRPEIIRLSRVIVACDKHFQHILVHTGQNYDYELNEVFFHDLGIRKPDYFLNAAGKTSSATIGNVIIAVDQLLEETQPEALLVLGDTNSCLAVLPAKRRKIPTFHMEAGNRCFDMRVPEEINRRIVDHTADINLTYSTIARDYLLAEGLSPDLIIKTGSPMFEVLHFYHERIKHSKILDKLGLTPFQYFVVSAHREENINSEPHFLDLIHTLNAVAKKYQYPVIVSTHPRTRKRIEELNITFHPLIQLLKPLGFLDYNKLQLMAKATLSDSGTINEESSILNFPALNLRQAHERPEGMEEAAVMLVGLQAERVLQGLAILDEQRRGQERDLRLVADYSMPNVSAKVIRILLSYTDYVNRVIWKKY